MWHRALSSWRKYCYQAAFRYWTNRLGIHKARLVRFWCLMLMLLFQVQDQPWAIAAKQVRDLVPLATIQPYIYAPKNAEPMSPEATVAVGLLNYHGEQLPVLDVSAAIANANASDAFSTRIAIVELERESPAQPGMHGKEPTALPIKCGLILEKAYKTVQLSESVNLPGHSPYVKQVLKGARQVVRQLAIAPLVHHVVSSMSAYSNNDAHNYHPEIA